MTTPPRHRDRRSQVEQLVGRALGPDRPLRRALGVVTRTGWSLFAAAAVMALAAALLGWGELAVAALALVVVVALCLLLVVGGQDPELSIDLTPRRLTPRRSADLPDPESTVRITVTNPRGRPQRAVVLDVPVGASAARFGVPVLGPGAQHEVTFTVPGTRRGVVVIGPVTTIRSDPFGVCRRVVSTCAPVELFVHPRVLPLPPLDAGLVRDLEGRSTSDPSDADLDFHTLRPYGPGDDRRHVHWLSSARASALSGTPALLTKTYNDTRRSHLGIVLDDRAASYLGDEDAFEDAVVTAASVAARAAADDIDLTVVSSGQALDRVGLVRTLDGLARVEPGQRDLPDLAARLLGLAPSASIVLLVTGSENPFTEVRRAGSVVGPSVRVVALRVHPGERSRAASLQEMTVLSLGDTADLPQLVTAGGL